MFGLFRKSKNFVTNPTVLIASIGPKDPSLIATDQEVYKGLFPKVEIIEAQSVADFGELLRDKQVDILHLIAAIDADKTIEGESGAEFFNRFDKAKVKLCILAKENNPNNLIPFCSEGVNAMESPMNLVMTLERKGDVFPRFFRRLMEDMVAGTSMPEAWVKLAPQGPGKQDDIPETVFNAGYGSMRFKLDFVSEVDRQYGIGWNPTRPTPHSRHRR